jgi:hypothetical protein
MRPFLIRLALLLWAIYTTLTPPGLPACWLEKVPCEFHTHFSEEQAETPHTHFYLFDLAMGMGSQPYPFLAYSCTVMVALLAMSGPKLWRRNKSPAFGKLGWNAIPEPPPPKSITISI